MSTQRPGVYSKYTASGVLWGNGDNKDIAIIAENNSVDTSVVYEIKRSSDATSIFGNDGLMSRLCTVALANGANKIQAVSAGNGSDSEYSTAFSLISNISSVGVVICDKNTIQVNTLLKNSVINSSENSHERIGIVSCSSEDIETFVNNTNCERILAFKQEAKDEVDDTLSGSFLAAALAGTIVNSTDTSVGFNGIALSSVNSLNETYTDDEIDDLLENGIAVFENIAGSIEIIRAVSTRTNTNGLNDLTYHDINTVMTIDDVIISIRNVLSEMLSTAKNNETTRMAIQTQTTVELQNKVDEGIIQKYSQPRVYEDETDSSICIVELSFTVTHSLNQIDIIAYVKV